jgi:hypothetical protein
MRACPHERLELSLSGLGDDNPVRRAVVGLAFGRREIATCPSGDDIRRIGGITGIAQQVVGGIEGDETLGMFGGHEERRRVVDADDLVARGMQHQKRLAEPCHAVAHGVLRQVVEKLPLDCEAAPGERDLRLSVLPDRLEIGMKIVNHVIGVRGSTDGGNGNGFGNVGGNGKHRRAAERMADQEARRLVVGP